MFASLLSQVRNVVKTKYWKPGFKRTLLKDGPDGNSFRFDCGLAAVALLGLLFIGYRARTATSNFQFVSCPPNEEAAITAYAPYVRQVEQQLWVSHDVPRLQTARKLAQQWIQATDDGTLKQIRPSSYSDLSAHGARREILAANQRIAEELNWGATQQTAQGRYEVAARDTLLAARVVQTTKFFDLYSAGLSAAIQRDSISRLNKTYRFLSPEMRCEAKEVAEQTRTTGELEPLAVNMRRNTLFYAEGFSMDPASFRSIEADLPLDRMLKDKSIEAVSAWADKQREVCKSQASYDVCRYLFLAYKGAAKTNQRLDQIGKAA